MTTTQDLQSLLDRAVQSLAIRGRGSLSDREYSLESYAQALREVQRRHAPDLRRSLLGCEIEIRDQTASDDLLDFLRATLRDYIHDDRIQTAAIDICGGPFSGYEVDEVARKLVRLAVSLGTAEAAALFAHSLTEPECRFQNLTLLGGCDGGGIS